MYDSSQALCYSCIMGSCIKGKYICAIKSGLGICNWFCETFPPISLEKLTKIFNGQVLHIWT